MRSSLLTLLALLFPINVFALTSGLDFSVSGSYRSLPLGGGVSATGAYNLLLWGDREAPPWFGFLRAGADASTALTYNSGAGFVEIFPVGFFAVKAGREHSSNAKEYDGFDCVLNDCTGNRRQDYAEARVAFPAGNAFFLLKERAEWYTREGADTRRFAEPTSGLLLDASGGARVRVSQVIVGAPVTEGVNMLVGQARYEATTVTSQSFVGGTYRSGEFSFFAAIGYWRAPLPAEAKVNFLLQGSWAPARGWSLF